MHVKKTLKVIFILIIIKTLPTNLIPFLKAEYPEKHIRVIVHVSPGGGTDTMTRLILHHAEKRLNTKFIIENHKGAGGQIGYTMLSIAKPDGYTIGTITTMSIAMHELTRKKVKYTLQNSFRPIARIIQAPSCLCVPIKSPYKNLDQLIEAAQTKIKKLSWGGTMKWGTHHVHLALLEQFTNIKMTYIPFDGTSETRTYLLGGHLDAGAGGTSEYASLVRQKKIRVLAVGSVERSPLFPEIPTYRELGYEFEIGSSRGFAAPAGTPKEYIDILSNTFQEVMEDPAFLEDAERIGIHTTLAYLNSNDFRNHLLNLQNNIQEMLKEFKKKYNEQ
jgi:tripartite-type tricarboxylate transporter receptor subunit TctC